MLRGMSQSQNGKYRIMPLHVVPSSPIHRDCRRDGGPVAEEGWTGRFWMGAVFRVLFVVLRMEPGTCARRASALPPSHTPAQSFSFVR